MGHPHHRALFILREIVIGLPEFNVEQLGVCRGCMLGKHANATFPSNEHRPKEILDLVHLDVYGLISVTSILGSVTPQSYCSVPVGLNLEQGV